MVDLFEEADNRKQTWEKDIKGFAKKRYVMKQLVTIMTTGSWTNSYYRKTANSLTAGTGSSIKGIGRGADFPAVHRGTTLVNGVIEQYGAEGVIYWQDILTSNLRIEAETISDVTDAIVNDIDGEIYDTLTENDTPTNINTVAIAAGSEWDSDTVQNRDPIQNLLDCVREITIDRYPILTSGQGYAVMNETDYALLMGNTRVVDHPTFKLANGIVKNGVLAQLVGLTILVSPVVTADKLLVVMAKRCGNWKEAMALTVDVIKDPQKKYTIRAGAIGLTELTDPEACCLLTNVRK